MKQLFFVKDKIVFRKFSNIFENIKSIDKKLKDYCVRVSMRARVCDTYLEKFIHSSFIKFDKFERSLELIVRIYELSNLLSWIY